jgi:hypothetical protein
MSHNGLISRILAIAMVAGGVVLMSGCTADPRDVYRAVKQIEPDAKKRNQEIRELTGVPEDEGK